MLIQVHCHLRLQPVPMGQAVPHSYSGNEVDMAGITKTFFTFITADHPDPRTL